MAVRFAQGVVLLEVGLERFDTFGRHFGTCEKNPTIHPHQVNRTGRLTGVPLGVCASVLDGKVKLRPAENWLG